jgi:cytochrome c oxidase subunit IV
MANHTAGHEHEGGSIRVIFFVWGSLLALTLFETFLAYQQLELKVMLGILMTLSIIKASLIIAYFMHLRYERRSLVLALMPALIFVIGMMFTVFPDSIRVALMKVR